MPVRSLHSAVFKWPRRDEVLHSARTWARSLRHANPNVEEVYCVGSCARGDWGVGSDADIIIVVRESQDPAWRRPIAFDCMAIPVPVDLWVYTREEWNDLAVQSSSHWRRWERERIELN